MRDLLLALACFALGGVGGFCYLAHKTEPPHVCPAASTQPAVVRMLDVTIRDSNTTNRRQRFICAPESGRSM